MVGAIGYCRISTSKQSDGCSIENQRDRIVKHCEFHEVPLRQVYVDDGISGKDYSNRPAFNEALEALQPGDCLIVYALSRMSRNLKQTLEIIEILEKKGCSLVSLTEKLDGSNAHGKFFINMMGSLAQLESNQTSDRTKANMKFLKESGRDIGRPKYGYKMVDKKFTPDETEQENIKLILQCRNEGMSLQEIADHLTDLGIQPRKASKKWHKQLISNIVSRDELVKKFVTPE